MGEIIKEDQVKLDPENKVIVARKTNKNMPARQRVGLYLHHNGFAYLCYILRHY